jgi:tRNA threonylcarbamoyladenosine biosynthesis protein TsaB
MTKILALETATDACSAALQVDGEITHRFTLAPRQHTNLILPMVAELLAEADLTIQQLDAIAYGAGPGSFTGVRVATSVTQGLALAHDLPVIGLSCLKILAIGAARAHGFGRIAPIMDARKSEVYCALYDVDRTTSHAVEVCADSLCSPKDLRLSLSADDVVVGTGSAEYRREILASGIPMQALREAPLYPSAIDALSAAQRALEAGETVAAEFALPIYLRQAL